MVCFSPFFTISDNGRLVGFPCGKCPVCMQKRANEWALRISLEARDYEHLAFVTLTYSPEKLYSYELIPSHLSSFIKRLRTYAERLGFDGKLRFYGVGEYGEKRGRPHFHVVLFGLPPRFWSAIKDAWRGSIVDIQIPRSSDAVASYVAGYVVKKLYTESKIVMRMSQGLGRSFVDKLEHFTQIIVQSGKVRYIGRYLRNRLAKRLGVFEQVKEYGLSLMEQQFSTLRAMFFPSDLIPWLPRDTRPVLIEAWQKLHRGEIDYVKSLHNLKFLKDTR